MLPDGRRDLDVLVVPGEAVELYANPAGSAITVGAELKIAIVAADGTRVPSEVTYPKPDRIESFDDIEMRFCTKAARVNVRFVPPEKEDLKVRCTYSGWNVRGAYCLGRRTIEADLRIAK